MDIKINVIRDQLDSITIYDLSNFLPENEIPKELIYKKSDVYFIDLLVVNTLDPLKEYISDIKYSKGTSDKIILPISKDGHLTLYHLIVPSKEWMLKNPNLYSLSYYSDGEKLYKHTLEGDDEEISDIIKILDLNSRISSSIYKTTYQFVSIINLIRCYILLNMDILLDKIFDAKCFNKSNQSELSYKRDLAQIVLSVVKYLAECGQFREALRIIENVQGCNGLCSTTNNQITNGCGCSR